MGLIDTAASEIWYIAYLQQASDPATIATRWQTYFKSGGMYHKDPSGAVLRILTSADLSGLGSTYQPLDADLTAIAALSSTGLIARTGAGTAAVRTITGTSNRIGVTNGDGVSGNPTLNVPDSAQLNVAKLLNLTTNGYVKTGGGDGTLSSVTGITVPTLIGSGNTAALAAGVTRYNCLFSVSQITTEANARSRLFWAGTLRNLSVRTTTTQGAAGSLVITIMINGSPTSITLTIAAGTAAGEFTDLVNTATVAAGDYIDIRFVNNDGANSSAATGNWTLEYDVVV